MGRLIEFLKYICWTAFGNGSPLLLTDVYDDPKDSIKIFPSVKSGVSDDWRFNSAASWYIEGYPEGIWSIIDWPRRTGMTEFGGFTLDMIENLAAIMKEPPPQQEH